MNSKSLLKLNSMSLENLKKSILLLISSINLINNLIKDLIKLFLGNLENFKYFFPVGLIYKGPCCIIYKNP